MAYTLLSLDPDLPIGLHLVVSCYKACMFVHLYAHVCVSPCAFENMCELLCVQNNIGKELKGKGSP